MECHLVLEERDPVVHDSMNEFGEDMLSEINQLQKHKSRMIPLICMSGDQTHQSLVDWPFPVTEKQKNCAVVTQLDIEFE